MITAYLILQVLQRSVIRDTVLMLSFIERGSRRNRLSINLEPSRISSAG